MGLTTSTPETTIKDEKLENIKKLFNNINDNEDNILESLDITEFKNNNDGKKQIPMVGGYSEDEMESLKLPRKRYTKYDLFKMLKDLESDFQTGGNGEDDENDEDDENGSSLNDEQSMDNIKRVILKELQNLKENKSNQLGGNNCGCDNSKKNKNCNNEHLNLNNVVVENQLGGNVILDDSSSSTSSSSSSDSDEAGKNLKKNTKPKKSKKFKKNNKKDEDDNVDDDEEESSRFFIQTSDTDENGMTSNGSVKKSSNKKKTNKKSKKNFTKNKQNFSEDSEGLSIFPFNSSDVKSSQSIQNFRNLRRRI